MATFVADVGLSRRLVSRLLNFTRPLQISGAFANEFRNNNVVKQPVDNTVKLVPRRFAIA
jgi:hypothetical protein